MSQHPLILSPVKPTLLLRTLEDKKSLLEMNRGLNEQLQIIYFTLLLSFGEKKK